MFPLMNVHVIMKVLNILLELYWISIVRTGESIQLVHVCSFILYIFTYLMLFSLYSQIYYVLPHYVLFYLRDFSYIHFIYIVNVCVC